MATSQTTVTVVNFALRLRVRDPRSNSPFDLPVGPTVHAMRGTQSLSRAPVAAQGRVALNVPVTGKSQIALDIDFSGNEYLDLDAKAFVAEAARRDNDTRPLLRMPARWQSKRQQTFSDDLGGRFKSGVLSDAKPDQQGTTALPWLLQIDHAWDRVFVQFDFYDADAKSLAAVPQGLLLEAFRTAAMKTADRVAGGSVLTDDGLICLAIHTRTQRSQLRLKLTTAASSFLDLRQHRPIDRMKVIAGFDALPGASKRALYPLPALWTSPNQHAFLAPSSDVVSKLITQNTSLVARLRFDLDDTMLVSETGLPVAIPANTSSRLALFDHVMAIRNEDAAQPYLSTDTIKGNHIPGDLIRQNGQDAQKIVRVIRFGAHFYDLTNRRTTSGTRIGVRAARRNDHPHQRMNSPLTTQTGLFDLHYFHDCSLDKGGQPLSHLLVFWSARYRKGHPTKPDGSPPATPLSTPNAIQLRAFEPATKTARIRHEGWHPSEPGRPLASNKNYFFKPLPAGATPNRTIKPVFHFAAFKNNEALCQVEVCSFFRDVTGQTSATYEVASSSTNAAFKATDVDGIAYEWFTMAHEIGHSLGLDDEYTEPIDPAAWKAATPAVTANHDYPEFDQWGPRYMRFDGHSLMLQNQAPRLRHYWQYARWINSNPAVQALLGSTQYKVQYPATGATLTKTFNYHLPKVHENFYKAVHSHNNHTVGTHGHMHLHVYRVGEDEMTLVPGKSTSGAVGADGFDSVLNITINLNVRFVGPGWNATLQEAQLGDLETVAEALRGQTRWHTLEDSGAPTFRKVLVYFELRYNIGGGAGRHFRLNSRIAGSAGAVDDLQNAATTSATIRITNATPPVQLLRYFLGLSHVRVTPAPAGSPAGTPPTTTPNVSFTAGELAPLATWLNGQRDAAPDNQSAATPPVPLHVHAYTHHRYP